MVFFRYKSLKDMIKTCLNDYELQKTEQRKAASSKTNTKGAGTFLEVASETNAVMSGKVIGQTDGFISLYWKQNSMRTARNECTAIVNHSITLPLRGRVSILKACLLWWLCATLMCSAKLRSSHFIMQTEQRMLKSGYQACAFANLSVMVR